MGTKRPFQLPWWESLQLINCIILKMYDYEQCTTLYNTICNSPFTCPDRYNRSSFLLCCKALAGYWDWSRVWRRAERLSVRSSGTLDILMAWIPPEDMQSKYVITYPKLWLAQWHWKLWAWRKRTCRRIKDNHHISWLLKPEEANLRIQVNSQNQTKLPPPTTTTSDYHFLCNLNQNAMSSNLYSKHKLIY